jgi:hypothetical protein
LPGNIFLQEKGKRQNQTYTKRKKRKMYGGSSRRCIGYSIYVGHQMLKKLGWRSGSTTTLRGSGRADGGENIKVGNALKI